MKNLPSDYQEYIARSRYARFLPEKARRETWEETVDRYCDYFAARDEKFPKALVKSSIFNLEVMPSMRALMTAGKALDRDNLAGYNCAYIAVDDPRAFDECLYALACGVGVGFSVERQAIAKMPIVSEEFHKSNTIIKVRDSKIGWATALRELVSLLYAGQIPGWDLALLRPAGAPLKTFGGRSSGPQPLHELFENMTRLFMNAAGRKLTSIECHDAMNYIATTIVVGGVRRSAQISLSNLSDERMRNAKTGQWWIDNPQRALANNSAAYTEKPDIGVFMDEWKSLYDSKSGERGIFNRQSAIKKMKSIGRRDWKKYEDMTGGANPCCFSGDMKLLTDAGYKTFAELSSLHDFNIISKDGTVAVGKVWSVGEKETVKLNVSVGEAFISTPDHEYETTTGGFIEAQFLKGHRLMPHYTLKEIPTNERDFKAGFIFGDAALSRIDSNTHLGLEVYIGDKDGELIKYFGKPVDRKVYSRDAMQIAVDYNLPAAVTSNRTLKNVDVTDDFMMGLYSANGCVIKSGKRVAFKTTSKVLSNEVRLWLESKSIMSYITTNKTKSVTFKNGEYQCKESYDVNIVGLSNLINFAKHVSFIHGYKQKLLHYIILESSPKVISVVKNGVVEVYDFNEPHMHIGVVNGMCVHNCEIFLRSCGLCNLSEVVIRYNDTLETIKKKIEVATIIGTYQSTLTTFRYLRNVWKKNADEERLLGVSLTGIMDHPVLSMVSDEAKSWLVEMRSHAIAVNKEWADKLGINQSVAVTTCKPSGTVSQLVDSASGIHGRYSDQYIRTVRSDKLDPIGIFLKSEGVSCEDDAMKPEKTWVFSFPIKSPDTARIASDISAIEQLEHYLMFYKNWAEHTVSISVYVREHEWLDVGAWVYKNFDDVGGISFLPYSGHSYAQAPYQPINLEQYEQAVLNHPKIDWSKFAVNEYEDNTVGSQTLACSGPNGCEI